MANETAVLMIENETEGPRFILDDISGERATLVEVDIDFSDISVPQIQPLWDLGEVVFDREIETSLELENYLIIEKAPANILVDEGLELKDGTTLQVCMKLLNF